MKLLWTKIMLCMVCACSSLAFANDGIQRGQIELKKETKNQRVKGAIKGYQFVDYALSAKAGQRLNIRLQTTNASAYFNVLPPNSETAVFVGSTSGDQAKLTLAEDGVYTIRVYLMRSAARRNEMARYGLAVKQMRDSSLVSSQDETSFDQMLSLQGIRFHVSVTHQGAVNTLRIVPSGLKLDNSPIVKTIDGTVTGAEVADLNVDGSPELYVYVTSAGSGSYGSVVAYAANHRQSLSEIYLPPVTDNKKWAQGYAGHDEFSVVENTLVQRFPVYKDTDTHAKASGGMRQLQYKLKSGEAAWQLKLDRVETYEMQMAH